MKTRLYTHLLTFATVVLLLPGGCARNEGDSYPSDAVQVSFSVPGVGGQVSEVVTRAESALAPGTTLRVVAYRHRTDGGLKADNYISEATYTVQPGGTLQADAEELSLPSGGYDFYTVTPSLAVNHAGDAPTVSVPHLTDYAVSLKAAAVVEAKAAGVSQTVQLATLERKCSQLALQLNVYGAVINKIKVNRVEVMQAVFTRMANAPLTGVETKDLPAAIACTTEATMSGSCFATDVYRPTLSSGAGVVLPKPADSFGLKLRARFNDSSVLNFEAVNIANLTLQKGYRYGFVAIWQENKFCLNLVVAPWTSRDIHSDLGSGGVSIYPLGQWTLTCIESDLGAGGVVVSVGGWTAAPSWTGNLGEGGVSVDHVPGWTAAPSWTGNLGEGGVSVDHVAGWTLCQIVSGLGGN